MDMSISKPTYKEKIIPTDSLFLSTHNQTLTTDTINLQENIQNRQQNEEKIDIIDIIVAKKSTDFEIKEKCDNIKKTLNIDIVISNIKRNSKGEIISLSSSFNDNKNNESSAQYNFPSGSFPSINLIKFGKNIGLSTSK